MVTPVNGSNETFEEAEGKDQLQIEIVFKNSFPNVDHSFFIFAKEINADGRIIFSRTGISLLFCFEDKCYLERLVLEAIDLKNAQRMDIKSIPTDLDNELRKISAFSVNSFSAY
ncbi:hypothetical protein P5673_019154 [Acropora cervicornis]|uniref:Uncharacterized protein n=1 Tax=Acropora cervicornis TaxID=6130 RepID=A0AAD9QC33_ACRCE|nr:hypothetical protein P5673_019154 [Acropora cervicornis]